MSSSESTILTKVERVAAKKARKLARRKARAEAMTNGLPPPIFSPPPPPTQKSIKSTASSPSKSNAPPTNKHGHTFTSKFNDHFETPLQAYTDLAPLLTALSGSSKIIYDPFFCKGSMVKHMHSIGFPSIINRNEDFWSNICNNTVPNYDICVTNPPYSDDDKEKTIAFIVGSQKPGFVLLPSYCGNKTWFKRASSKCSLTNMFVLRPRIDYQYKHLIEGKQKDSSPFHSSWFCFNVSYEQMKRCSTLVQQIESGLKDVGVKFTKRLSSKRRKALKRKRGGM